MIEIDILIPAPLQSVWSNLTEEAHIHEWWDKEVTLELKIGGRFCEPWVDNKKAKRITLGTVISLEPQKRLQIRWQDAGWPRATLVDFNLKSDPDGGTRLSIQHSGWGAFDDQKQRQKKFDEHKAGWQDLAEHLREYCMR